MYDPQIEFPQPLVPPQLTFGIAERIRADGSVLAAPDLAQVDAVAAELKARNVQSVAICFLNSFANPDHERLVAKRIGELLPGPVHHAVLGRGAADPRVSARIDRHRQRLHDADLPALSAAPEQAAGAAKAFPTRR